MTAGPFVRITLEATENHAEVLVCKGDYAHSRHTLRAGERTSLFLEEPEFFDRVNPTALIAGRFSPAVWRLRFHQNAIVTFHEVDSFGHALRAPMAGELPAKTWLAYGSSITFGGNAWHPSNAYTQRAARLLGVDVLCKGIPGSCLCEPEMAEFFANGVAWDFATLELGVNLAELATPEEFAERAGHFVEAVHRAHPDRPVFVLNIYPNRADQLLDPNTAAARNNPIFNAEVARLVAAIGHSNVRFIDGREILPDFDGLCTDLVHPDDDGHILMGANLASALARFLGATGSSFLPPA